MFLDNFYRIISKLLSLVSRGLMALVMTTENAAIISLFRRFGDILCVFIAHLSANALYYTLPDTVVVGNPILELLVTVFFYIGIDYIIRDISVFKENQKRILTPIAVCILMASALMINRGVLDGTICSIFFIMFFISFWIIRYLLCIPLATEIQMPENPGVCLLIDHSSIPDLTNFNNYNINGVINTSGIFLNMPIKTFDNLEDWWMVNSIRQNNSVLYWGDSFTKVKQLYQWCLHKNIKLFKCDNKGVIRIDESILIDPRIKSTTLSGKNILLISNQDDISRIICAISLFNSGRIYYSTNSQKDNQKLINLCDNYNLRSNYIALSSWYDYILPSTELAIFISPIVSSDNLLHILSCNLLEVRHLINECDKNRVRKTIIIFPIDYTNEFVLQINIISALISIADNVNYRVNFVFCDLLDIGSEQFLENLVLAIDNLPVTSGIISIFKQECVLNKILMVSQRSIKLKHGYNVNVYNKLINMTKNEINEYIKKMVLMLKDGYVNGIFDMINKITDEKFQDFQNSKYK